MENHLKTRKKMFEIWYVCVNKNSIQLHIVSDLDESEWKWI